MRNIIIIGSGPAAYTAAIYAARAGRAPLVIEGGTEMGGALMLTSVVENFPGFPEGIEGPELAMQMRAQAEKFGAEFLPTLAVDVDLQGRAKRVLDSNGDWHIGSSVIVATGASHRKLGLENEVELTGKGVHTCATCDAAYFYEKNVAVVGGGDSAMEESLFLARFARSVTIIHRRSTLRASKIMQERALASPKISFMFNTLVERIHGSDAFKGLDIRPESGELERREFDGLFVAIGHDPRSELFRGKLQLDQHGHILVQVPTTKTNIEGVFAAGDVVDGAYRQAVTAASTGCIAALDADRYLEQSSHTGP